MDFDFFITENNKGTNIFGGNVIGNSFNIDSFIEFTLVISYGGNARSIEDTNIEDVSFQSLNSICYGGAVLSISTIVFGGAVSAASYIQRIFDITLNKYVYYKLTTKTNLPSPTQTTPNHSGNLRASSHEVVFETTEIL